MQVTFVLASLGLGGAELVVTVMANYWAARGWNVAIVCLNDGGGGPPFFKLDPAIQFSFLKKIEINPSNRVPQAPSRLTAVKQVAKRVPLIRRGFTLISHLRGLFQQIR